jgi:hypothetical protein
MNGGQVIQKVRDLIGESSTRRFSDALILSKASDAQRQIALRLDHPEGQMRLPAVSGVKEYQMPAAVKILRTYILGPGGSQTAIVGTDIPTLEGEIQNTFDNTSGIQQGNPLQTPQWLSQQAESYPVVNTQLGGFVPTKNQWSPNARPSYYMRGGYVGFAIPPLNANPAATIILDYIPSPPDFNTAADVSIFPDLCKDAIAYYVVSEIMFSVNSSQATMAMQEFERQLVNVLGPWIYSFQANRPKMIVPVTRRAYFQGRGRR